MSVRTRGEAAARSGLQHFREIEGYFLRLEIHESESAYARSVNYASPPHNGYIS